MKRSIPRVAPLALACAGALPTTALAGLTVHEDGAKYVKVGGRVQVQYHRNDPDGGDTTDDLDIRRAWITIDASAAEDWKGRLQFQLDGGLSTKDAKLQYTGWDVGTLTVGNFYVPFSREELTSSKRQQLVEKTTVAGTGSPARQIGLSLAGGGETMNWEVGLWEAGMVTDVSTITFASQVDDDQDYEGKLAGGRFELHPGGNVGYGQGNLGRRNAWEIAVNAFSWSNDDDRVTSAAQDYEDVTGIGVDGAWRMGGWSVDAEANAFTAETLASGTAGIVENGEAEVQTFSVEGGYMIVPARWEVVAGLSTEDADAWNETETQAGVGVNTFFSGHDDKLQLSFISTSDAGGVAGADQNDLYLQVQHAF